MALAELKSIILESAASKTLTAAQKFHNALEHSEQIKRYVVNSKDFDTHRLRKPDLRLIAWIRTEISSLYLGQWISTRYLEMEQNQNLPPSSSSNSIQH